MPSLKDDARQRFWDLAKTEPVGTGALAWDAPPLRRPSEEAMTAARRMVGYMASDDPRRSQRRLIALANKLDALVRVDRQAHPQVPDSGSHHAHG